MKEQKIFSFDVTAKSVNEEQHSVQAVFSHAQKDRAGDVLPPQVLLDGAENFRKNPVLLDSHAYGSVKNIIGRVEDLHAEGDALAGTAVYFCGKGNEAADWAFTLAKEGLAAFSVGFRALDYEYITDKGADGREVVTGYRFKKAELLEISQAAVPCNPRALRKIFNASPAPTAPVPEAESGEAEKISRAFKAALEEINEVIK